MGEGSAKFFLGAAIGAVGGFAVGTIVATPAARSAGHSVLGGLETTARLMGGAAFRAVDEVGSFLEAGYTRVRGREAYLEHEIEQLREKISDLEQRMQ